MENLRLPVTRLLRSRSPSSPTAGRVRTHWHPPFQVLALLAGVLRRPEPSAKTRWPDGLFLRIDCGFSRPIEAPDRTTVAVDREPGDGTVVSQAVALWLPGSSGSVWASKRRPSTGWRAPLRRPAIATLLRTLLVIVSATPAAQSACSMRSATPASDPRLTYDGNTLLKLKAILEGAVTLKLGTGAGDEFGHRMGRRHGGCDQWRRGTQSRHEV